MDILFVLFKAYCYLIFNSEINQYNGKIITQKQVRSVVSRLYLAIVMNTHKHRQNGLENVYVKTYFKTWEFSRPDPHPCIAPPPISGKNSRKKRVGLYSGEYGI